MFRTAAALALPLLFTVTLKADDKPKDAASEKKPDAKVEASPKSSSETTPDSSTPARRRARGLRGDGEGHRGRVSKATLESGVLKIMLDGKEYEFTIGDKTRAMIRTMEKDGKEEVVGLMMMNGDRQQVQGTKGKKRTRPTTKP